MPIDLPPEPRPENVRPADPTGAQRVRDDVHRKLQNIKNTVDPSFMMGADLPDAVRKELASERLQPLLRAYSTLKGSRFSLAMREGGIEFTQDGKSIGFIPRESVEANVWQGDILHMLKRPIGDFSIALFPETASAWSALQNAEMNRGLLTNLQQLDALQGHDPVGVQTLLKETQESIGAARPVRVSSVKGAILITDSQDFAKRLAYMETGSTQALDANATALPRKPLAVFTKTPALEELPSRMLVAYLAQRAGIANDGSLNVRAEETNGKKTFVLTQKKDGAEKEWRFEE